MRSFSKSTVVVALFFCCVRQNISFNHVRNSQTAHNIDLLIIVAKKGFLQQHKLKQTHSHIPQQAMLEKCKLTYEI